MVMSTISEDRTFYWYLIYNILANPDRVTEQNNIWEKNPLPILLFNQNSLQIKFVPLLESKPAKPSCEIKKDDKVGNKNGHKNKGKEEKKKREKRSK